MTKAREINKINCTMTMCLSLETLFEEIKVYSQPSKISRASQDFLDMKELAKRFALSFGLDAVKNREAVTALHRAGILFGAQQGEQSDDALAPPPNLLFLEVLTEFTNKLIKQDKKLV